jgi:alpha-tubulin suppressor-like RCC1 family protein
MSELPYVSFRDDTVIVASLSCGPDHSCALFDNKRIYCWGYGFYGQLGQSTNDSIGMTTGSMTSYDYIVFSNTDGADMIAAGDRHTYEA